MDNPFQNLLGAQDLNPTQPQESPFQNLLGNPPVDTTSTQGIGPMNLSNATMLQHQDNGSYNGYCQRFVEDATYGRHDLFPSAIDAWQSQPNKVTGLQGVKPGDLVYFTANSSNNYDGHVGIYEGNGMFKSATDTGIEDLSLQDWNKTTGQVPLGYIPVQ